VIICDEITSGLDASVQAALINLLRQIRSEMRVALLLITHDLNLLRHAADRVAVMYLGRVVEKCAASAISAPPYHPYTEALLSSAPTLDPGLDVRRVRLTGSPPTRVGALTDCPFLSRCPQVAGDICAQAMPAARSRGDDHSIACHLELEMLAAAELIWRARAK
jgi:peptide/nickel transport system ATP-binding protein